MSLDTAEKQKLIETHQVHATDTGSVEVQVAMLSKKISITGSSRVGKLILKQAADKVQRVTMELSGHSPFIVFDDADIKKAADMAIAAKFRNNGQVCISPNRFYIQENVKDEFDIKDSEINKMMEDLQLTLQSLNYKNNEINTILPIIINEVDLLAKKENNLSFENLLKLAMNYLDKESSNIAS